MSRILDRQGLSLVELLVAIVVAALVMGGITAVLLQNQRIYTQSSEQVIAQQAVRGGIEILSTELREISPSLGDILSLANTELTIRTVRSAGVICGIPSRSPLRIRVRSLGGGFAADDPVTFFVADSADIALNDYWATGTVSGVTADQLCPGNVPAQDLEFTAVNPAAAATGVQLGGMIRSLEPLTYGPVTYGGRTYLGRGEPGGSSTPLVGPIDATGGIRFTYRDGAGNTTATPTAVRTIELTVRTTSRARGEGGRIIADSLTALIHLRN